MKTDIKIPAMGESISSATIGTLLKSSGAQVKADEEIVELETEKVNQVLYAPEAGTLTWSVAQGDVVKIGQIIGSVESGGEKPTEAKPQPEAKSEEKPQEVKPEKKPQEPEKKESPTLQPPIPGGKSAEPGARFTKEAFIQEVKASTKTAAPAQQLLPEEATASKKEAPPPPQKVETEQRETRRKISRIRRVIADRLVQVQQSTASLTTFNEVDMTAVLELREKYKELFTKQYGVRLGFMSFFVKAVVSALQAFPDFNAYIDGDEIVQREYFNIGVAVGTDKGVFVPVVRNCDQLTYAEIEAAIAAQAGKAREGSLAADDLQGGGFTITNGGVYGSLVSTPILNPPQCGILGMHKIEKRAVVVEDEIVIRPMMYLALTYDHRIADGREAVSFLVHIKNMLEDPMRQVLHV